MKTTAPKRFLMMTTFFPPEHAGGDGVHVRRLCELLVSAGHEVSVLASSDAFKLKQLEAKVADQAPGLKVYRLRTSWPWMNAVLTHQTGLPVFYRAEIERVLEEVRPDVIHYHNISLLGGPGLLSLGQGVKICTLHDHWAVCPTHALFKFNRTPAGRNSVCSAPSRPGAFRRFGGTVASYKRACGKWISFYPPANSPLSDTRATDSTSPAESFRTLCLTHFVILSRLRKRETISFMSGDWSTLRE